MTDHGVFYPNALHDDLVFHLTLAPADQVVRGSDTTKLVYKLTNIEMEYEMIRSKSLAVDAASIYTSGKAFAFDHVALEKVVTIDKGTEKRINIKVNAQRRSMKAILLLFVEAYAPGTRDSEKYIFPDLKKISVSIGGKPNMLYSDGIFPYHHWREVSQFFMEKGQNPKDMDMKKFYTKNKFGLLFDLRSMKSQKIHGSSTRLVNVTEGVHLAIERYPKGSGEVNCHIFIISDAQFNIQNRQLESVQK